MSKKNLGVLVVVVFIVAVAFTTSILLHKSSTTSVKQESKESIAIDIDKQMGLAQEQGVSTSTETKDNSISAQATTNKNVVVKVVPTQPTQAQQQPKQVVVTHQKAELPLDAVKGFAKSLEVGNVDVAVSYFMQNTQKGYRESFKKYADKGQIHPVAHAVLYGKVDPVKLVDADTGLYEIPVYPEGFSLPFRIRVIYDNKVGEFVITEL